MLRWWIRFRDEWMDYICLGILFITLVVGFNYDNIVAAIG